MEEMDDFGDLYADLDDSATAGVAPIPDSKPNEFDSISEEDTPGDSTGEADGSEAPVVGPKEGNEVAECSDSSDSEDDLRIVLNEDGRKFQSKHRMVLGSGGMAAEWNDVEDEGDNLVLITGAEPPGNDQKWAEQLLQPVADGSPQVGAERGSTKKSGYRNWHVGSHLVGFPSNARTSISGRGDWDHPMMPCSGVTAPSNPGIPVAATFSLPRNRTIFDIDIEEFAQKPWKHHGVDVTDYFNFGLDEESWKSYCKSMEHLRQKATGLRFPIYESSRLNQVFESGMVSTKTLSSEVARAVQGEIFSSSHENVDKDGRGFEMPRGRAIQVEGGFGERIPSTDIRRPRLRDSGVVIQITMKDSIKDASASCEEELKHVEGHINDPVLNPEKDFHTSLSPDHDDQRFGETTSPVEHDHPENGTIFRGTAVKVKAKVDCKMGDALNPPRAAATPFPMADDSATCDRVLHSSSPSDLKNHSVASEDGFSSEKVHSPGKRTSLSSVSESQKSIKSDCYVSNDSKSDATETEQENSEDRAPDSKLSMVNQKYYSMTRHQSRAEFSTPTNSEKSGCSEKASIHSYRKHRNVSFSMNTSNRTRTRKSDNEFDAAGHLTSYGETEMSRGRKSRIDAKKHVGEKPYVNSYNKKGSRDTSLWRNQDERDYLLKERAATRTNRIKQGECYLHERYHDDRRMKIGAHEDCNQPISEYKSRLMAKDSCMWQKRDRKNEHWNMTEAEYDDTVFEERYREEYLQEMHGRNIPDGDREEGIFYHKFARHVSHTAGELRSPEIRYTYESNSCFDLNRASRYTRRDAKNWRNIDRRLLNSQTYSELPIADDRCWADASSPINHSPISWRSSERHVDHRRLPNTIQTKNKKDGFYFVPSSQDHYRCSYEDAHSFDDDGHNADERDLYRDNIVSSKKGRYNCLAKRRHFTYEMKFRNQEQDGLSSPEGSPICDRISRHEKGRVSQQFDSDLNFSDDHMLNSSRKWIVTEGSSGSDSRDHANLFSDFLDKGRHELRAIGCREDVNMHVNGWKGKFPKRDEVTRKSEGQSYTHRRGNKKLKDAGRIEDINTRKEVPPHSLKVERTCARPTSRQVVRVGDYKSELSDDHILKTYNDKSHIQQDNEDDEIEEGQLVEESDVQDVVSVTKDGSSNTKMTYSAVEASQSNCVEERSRQSKDFISNNKIVGGYDNTRILETLAKMEKRQERFKEPIAPKPIPEKIQHPQLEVSVATEEVQQKRPARKRRWAGS